MNGKKAKRIRREVYGDNSLKEERLYKDNQNAKPRKFGKLIKRITGTLTQKPDSLRRKYKEAKRGANGRTR